MAAGKGWPTRLISGKIRPMIKIVSTSSAETMNLGKRFADKLKGGEILGLKGKLGSGKTTFVKGLARGLKIDKPMKSPTFVIFSRYAIPKTTKTFYHFDLYRLQTSKDLNELGFREIITDPKNVVAIEWPERAGKVLPARTIFFQFTHSPKTNSRIIKTWQKK
jgi:tRNA threonylcarbamoyladenosine biosynthesis protein TsaE